MKRKKHWKQIQKDFSFAQNKILNSQSIATNNVQ